MKSIKPVKLISDSLKGVNEWLKNAQKIAAELDQFKGRACYNHRCKRKVRPRLFQEC